MRRDRSQSAAQSPSDGTHTKGLFTRLKPSHFSFALAFRRSAQYRFILLDSALRVCSDISRPRFCAVCASNLWVQSSLNQKQRLQKLCFPEGVRFDGKRLVGTGLTLPVFNYLAPAEDSEVRMVDQTGIEPVTS